MEQSGRRRKLSRSQTATKSIRKALKEQSPNIPIGLSKRMVHSIPSLVNPHAQLTALEVQVAEEEQASQDVLDTKIILSKPGQQVQFKNGKIPVMRPVTVAGTRADNLLRWKGFAKGMSYGQDILVQDIQNTMMKQSLEDFYRTTDGKYSAKLPKYRPPSVRRTKTPHNEKMEKERRSNTVMTPQINPLGKQILQHFEQEFKEPVQWLETRGQDISLDTVVNMIDTVTEDMNHFREKLAPTPQPGFRRPASSGVSTKPLSRPTTSQSQRSSSLVQKSNTPILEQTRSPSIQLSSRDIMLLSQDEADSYTCNSPLPGSNEVSPLPGSNEVQVVDWRGKSAPDTARYKWEKTKSGGYTYVKKLMNATSAGTSRAGKRPTTAPVSARERWNITDKPSDQNVRLAQAATNTMMLVDQKSVDSMMVIQHILGSSDSRMGSLGSLFLEFEYLRPSQLRQRPLPPTNATPEYEYVTDMCTSAPLSAAASRAQSRLSRYSERTESQVDFVPSHLPEKEVSIPIATDEQLPLMDDEETTQTDQVAPAEITYHIPLVEKPQTKYSDISLSRASSTDHFEISDSDLTGEEDVDCERARQGSQVGEKVTVTEKTSENFQDNGEIVSNSEKQVKERTESNFKLVSPQKEENVLIRITPISSKEKEGSKPQSDVWQYSSDGEIEKDLDQFKKIKSILANQSESALYHHGKSIVKSDTYCSNWSSQSNSAKVEKLAGRMPRGTDSVPGQVIKMTKKQNVPPLRMPASIPSPHHPLGGRSPRQGHVYSAELEQQARKMNSPRNFMNKINELRKDRSRSAPPVSPRMDISLASTLQVCHLPIPGRSRGAPMFQLGDEEHYPHTQQGLEPMTEGASEHREEHVTSPTRVAFKSLDENDSHKSRAYIDHPIAQICQLPGPEVNM